MSGGRVGLVVVVWFGYVLALGVLPEMVPTDRTLPNVAARAGYHTGVAYVATLAWTGIVLTALAAARWRRGRGAAGQTTAASPQPDLAEPASRRGWVVWAVAACAGLVVYWPPFLARYGHYIEDAYFLNILLRIECGQLPYRDFEFLYAPLMIYPAAGWMAIAGYSLQSYYWLLAVAQVTALLATVWLFERHVADPRRRYIGLLVFAPFVFDVLLGLNYTFWRALLPLFAITAVAARPADLKTGGLAGVLLALQLTYSYEYGLAGLAAVMGLLAVLFWERDRQVGFRQPLVVLTVALSAGALATWAVTGATMVDYLAATRHLLAEASREGLGNLPFHWTVNSLALFGLLSLAVSVIATSLPTLRRQPTNYGDRLLLGGLLFALASLRFALQRADVWHLSIPFTLLLLVALWQPTMRVMELGPVARRLAVALVVTASASRMFGVLPEWSHFGTGWAKGARDVLSGRPSAGSVDSRTVSVATELTRPDPDSTALAAALASPEWRARPVLLYGDNWWKGIYVGVCPAGYSAYKLMYTDSYRPLARLLDAHPDALVIMDANSFDGLLGATATVAGDQLSPVKRAGLWLSSIHWAHKDAERDIRQQVWRRNVGEAIARTYRPVMRIGRQLILEHRDYGGPIVP